MSMMAVACYTVQKCEQVDLQLTKDGHPVLIHDYSVDRTSNGQGNVQDLTFKQIKELDVGAKFGLENWHIQ